MIKKTSYFFILLLLLVGVVSPVLAVPAWDEPKATPQDYTFEVGIPGVISAGHTAGVNGLPDLLKKIVFFLYIIGAIIAFVTILLAGFKYMTSQGNMSKTKDAVDQITKALIGLFLMLSAYLILYTINPDLVKLPSDLFTSPNAQLQNMDTPGEMPTADMSGGGEYNEGETTLSEKIVDEFKNNTGVIAGDSTEAVIKDLEEKRMDRQLLPVMQFVIEWALNEKPPICGKVTLGPIVTGHVKRTDIDGGDYDSCHEEGQGKAFDIAVNGNGANQAEQEKNQQTCQKTLKDLLDVSFTNIDPVLNEINHLHVQTKDCPF